jgi:predicted SprT family Zn-dependent metalloprotease
MAKCTAFEINNLEMSEFRQLIKRHIPQKPKFMRNRNDTCSVWECCECGNVFITTHRPGILAGTEVYYCSKCGQRFDWSVDE